MTSSTSPNRWPLGRLTAAGTLFATLCVLMPAAATDVPSRPGPTAQPQATEQDTPETPAAAAEPPSRSGPEPQPVSVVEEPEEPVAPEPIEEIVDVVEVEPTEVIAPLVVEVDDGLTILGPAKLDRRETDEIPVTLNFHEESIEAVLPFIVEWTGKTVIVPLTKLVGSKITLINDHPVTKHEALDLLFQAFRLNGVGIMETEKIIMIDLLDKTNLQKMQPGVVLGPEVDVMDLDEDGNIVLKVYRLTHAKVGDVYERLNPSLPEYATFTVDSNSNQLILEGDIGLAKRFQRLIDVLDVPPYITIKTETFRLAYADATIVSEIIVELFASTGTSARSSSTSRSRTPTSTRRTPQQSQQANTGTPEVGTSEQLSVSVLPQTNSITIRAEPDILMDIRYLIENAWDVPPSHDGNIFRLYDLEYTDPVKVKNLLSALLEEGGGSAGGAGRGAAAPSGAGSSVADIFRIEAYPDSNRLVIISKTPDNFNWLDEMIDAIDQPLSVGMPINIELKHASALEIADILNALLAATGGGGRGIRAPSEGLGGINFDSSGGGSDGGGTEESSEEITFPWQTGRASSAEEMAEVSGLIGKSRVVPNPGQNSLLVLATPEIQTAVLQIIEDLDRPGRQVMITATLAEVTLTDGLNLGVRMGRGIASSGDNTFMVTSQFEASKTSTSWFDMSTLGVGADINLILQAIAEENQTRILQRPRVFTSDNKEAVFFSGQDVSFQTGETSTSGSTTSSYEERAIGVGLNVRPRITAERNVAMQIQVLLSDLAAPQLNAEFNTNNPIVNRRETTTTITVKNGQTIVISGIRFEDETDIKRKVPLLGDIPIFGNIFTSTEKSKNVRELLIFITPTVVDNPDENDDNFNLRERDRLEDLSKPLDDLQREFHDDTDFFDHLDGKKKKKTRGAG